MWSARHFTNRRELVSILMSMKALAFLVFSFLVVPGSGFLVWDGLPLSGRIEFASLLLFVLVFFTREARSCLANSLRQRTWARFITPTLVVLCTIKLLSFAWAPVGHGFESCYRSIYNPLPELDVCEKSYEGPFLRDGSLPTQNISRIDSTVDFGRRAYDWSLPFMNEYPRLGAMWLQRFPFESKHFAATRVSEDRTFLPVLAIGELSVSVDGQNVARIVNYERPFLNVVPLPIGRSEVLIEFRYRDEDRTDPETPPEPRGPYAQLKVGEPNTRDEILKRSQIVITGAISESTGINLGRDLLVKNRNGDVVEMVDLNNDNSEERKSFMKKYEFEVGLPATSLVDTPLSVVARTASSELLLATIETSNDNPFELRVAQPIDSRQLVDVGTYLAAERTSLQAFKPEATNSVPLTLRALLIIADLAALLMSAVLAYFVSRVLRSMIFPIIGMALIVWIAVEPMYSLLPGFLGGGRELVVPYALVSLLIVVAHRNVTRYPLLFLLPTATVLAAQKVFEHLYFNHPGESEGWWGKLLYYWRDSDWYVAQGYARTIFTEGSLRGGESIFWFQSGPRYLALVTRLLLGENDVLVGLIFMTAGFLVVWILACRFLEVHRDSFGKLISVVALFLLQIFLGDQIITAFGFVVSSEYPTWLAVIGVSAFVLRSQTESRVWYTSGVAGISALIVHFRPNLIVVSFVLLILVLFKIEGDAAPLLRRFTSQSAWATATYAAVIPLSLVHNLYYGQSFVPFASNAGINYAFNWTELFEGQSAAAGINVVWTQFRELMYWRVPHDPNFAIFFWGSQIIFIFTLLVRLKRRLLGTGQSLFLLMPLAYVLPMLKFQYESYYPRHLVAASLLCLCSAMLAWPKAESHRVSAS